MLIDGGRVLHHKLAAVAVGVSDPQLGDGDVKLMGAGVSADAGAALVVVAGNTELAPGVLEQHIAGLQPGALQVHAKGREAAGLQRTGQQHRLALLPLQEHYLAASWSKKKRKMLPLSDTHESPDLSHTQAKRSTCGFN